MLKKEFNIKDFFSIKKTVSHDICELKSGNNYDYITRSVLNRGIARTTGLIDDISICDEETFSLELMNMTFFWRERKWYAGQFVRKVEPKYKEISECWEYFETIFGGITKLLKTVLVRDVDSTFLRLKFDFPIKVDEFNNPIIDETKQYNDNGFIPDWSAAKKFINSIKEQYIPHLENLNNQKMDSYLKVAGINIKDIDNIDNVSKAIYKEFEMNKLFKIYTGRDVIIRDTKKGNVPLVSHTNINNGVTCYIKQLENRILFDHKKTIALADRGLFWASVHEEDFHVGTRVKALELRDGEKEINVLFYLATAINGLQALFTEYLINATDKLPSLKIWLPVLVKDGNIVLDMTKKYSENGYIPDWNYMNCYIENIKKMSIKELKNKQEDSIKKTRTILDL